MMLQQWFDWRSSQTGHLRREFSGAEVWFTIIPAISSENWWSWLVVWNIFYDFPYIRECHHPNWRTHIFQRGRSTTNQCRWLHIVWSLVLIWDSRWHRRLFFFAPWNHKPLVELHAYLLRIIQVWSDPRWIPFVPSQARLIDFNSGIIQQWSSWKIHRPTIPGSFMKFQRFDSNLSAKKTVRVQGFTICPYPSI